MDLHHPQIIEAIAAHEGDSTLYMRLCVAAMDVNELCQGFRRDINKMGLALARAMLDIEDHLAAGRITTQQRNHLKLILNEDLEEPTADNDVPVYKLRFPSPDYSPPPAA